jgi:hypothetical protein
MMNIDSDNYWKNRDDIRKGKRNGLDENQDTPLPIPQLSILSAENANMKRRHSSGIQFINQPNTQNQLPVRKEYKDEVTYWEQNNEQTGVIALSPKLDSIISEGLQQRRRAKSLTPNPIGQHISKTSPRKLFTELSSSPNTLSLFTSGNAENFIKSISPLHSSPTGPSLIVDSVLDESQDERRDSVTSVPDDSKSTHYFDDFISHMGGLCFF